MKSEMVSISLKLKKSPGELGAYVIQKAKENECSVSSTLRKIVKNAKEEEEKKQLKNMPLFKK